MTAPRRIVIVGAATGIGAAGAQALAAAGWRLALLDIADEPLKRVARGTNAHAYPVDASDPDALVTALNAATEELGGLDAAWSNVGVQVNGTVTDTSLADFDRCIALNLRAHFVCAQTVIPRLAESGGRLIITASNAGLQTESAMIAYATTKAAAIALMRNLARDAAPLGVRVNALCPGFVDTPFNAPVWANYGGRDSFLKEIGSAIPLGRMSTAEDVSGQLLFLLSESATLMTGQTIVVDGGELVS